MISTLTLTAILLLVCLLPGLLPAAGFTWDWLGGIGFAALAVLVGLALEAESPARQPRLFAHRNIAVVATVLVWLHALGYLALDPVSIEYLLPKAPGYMLVGLVSGIVLLGLTATAFPTIRRYCYASFGSFRRWHLALSVATLAGSVWHIIGTQFIVTGAFRLTLFSALVIGLPAFAYQHRRAGKPAFAPSGAATASRDYVLITLGCLLLAAGYAGVRNL
jgi:hypothetical protein